MTSCICLRCLARMPRLATCELCKGEGVLYPVDVTLAEAVERAFRQMKAPDLPEPPPRPARSVRSIYVHLKREPVEEEGDTAEEPPLVSRVEELELAVAGILARFERRRFGGRG